MRLHVSCCALFLMFFGLLCVSAAQAKNLFPEAELIEFTSIHSNLDRSAIIGKRPPMRQQIYGYFFKAEEVKRAGTLIYIHSSSGLYRRLLGQWIEPLTKGGYNVFVVDSFTPRGVGTTTADQTQVFDYTMVIDANRALQAIASRPDVDLKRVAVMGGSKGGIVAYQTLYREYRDAAQIGALSYKLHLPLYPTCNWNDWSARYTEGQVVALLGAADDFTPASLCVLHFEKMRKSGANVRWTVYEGFHHGFDNGQGVRHIPNASTSRNCGVYVDLSDLQVKRRSDESVVHDAGAHYSNCNERGAHTGGTVEQQQRVRTEILKTLSELL